MDITNAGIHKPEYARPAAVATTVPRFGAEADATYRDSLGEEAWLRLKPEVRERFAAKPGRTETIRYAGIMQRVNLSFMGWLFAQACRVIGTPLAPFRGSRVPMRIELLDDTTIGGVTWRRIYSFAKH
ncbi:MAG: DUF4166 domain-containing protein, partial [Woeseiaceae bacterium]